MSLSVGGVSTNELLIGAAVIGGAYLLYQAKGASDDLAAVEDDEGCPDPSLQSVVGVVLEPWAYAKCAANTVQDIPWGELGDDFVAVADTVGDAVEETATAVVDGFEVAAGFPIPYTPNLANEATRTSDFEAWVNYANQLQANNPTKIAAGATAVDAYGCMDTRWLPPFPGNPTTVAKVCNDNSGCYAESFWKENKSDSMTTWSNMINGKPDTSGMTDFGVGLSVGAYSCAVAADNSTLAELNYDAVKANPLPIPLPSDSPQSLQMAGFGVSFENAANLLNKGYKMPPKGKVPGSANITVGNINSMYSSNPMDNPSMPVPPGGWK